MRQAEIAMSRKVVALYTFGVFRRPAADPANQDFMERNDLNFQAVEASEGFLARSGYDGDPGPTSWGQQVYPRFYEERGDGWAPSTLSLWRDLESPMAFTYGGIHAEALKHGREWFLKPAWPPYVLWWTDKDKRPDWADGVERHAFLHDNPASPFAFDFQLPFDAEGQPTMIDRAIVRHQKALNDARQQAFNAPRPASGPAGL
jgi:Domain of unknown function (DUF3291)